MVCGIISYVGVESWVVSFVLMVGLDVSVGKENFLEIVEGT